MPEFKQSRGFKMKGFPAHTGVSPLRNGKKESMRAKDERVLSKAADKTKEGGVGATSYEEAEAVNLAKQRSRAKEIHGMSKREALKASGKKANLWNLATKSKRKLKTKLRGKSVSDYYATKGTGIGQQAEQSDLRKDDKFTGVKEKSPLKINTTTAISMLPGSKKADKFIGKALDFGANAATGGVYGTTKKYNEKQGGLAKTLDKHFPVKKSTREQKKKNTKKIENFISKLSFKKKQKK